MLKMWGKYRNVKLSLYYAFVASLAKENCWIFKKKLISDVTEL